AVRTPTVPRDRLFTPLDRRTEDEVLGLEHLGDRGIDVGFDREILRLKIQQRHVHAWLPLSAACTTWCLYSMSSAAAAPHPGRDIGAPPAPVPGSDTRSPDIASRRSRPARADGRAGSSNPPVAPGCRRRARR